MNIRDLERQSIRGFIQHCADANIFRERDVLDYGCGKQPYREQIVFGGGRYTGYDQMNFPANVSGEDIHDPEMFDRAWGVVACTQVIQYVPNALGFLMLLHGLLADDGRLVISWPTNWPEVEREDLWRFTLSGMAKLIHDAGFSKMEGTPRAFIQAGDSKLFLGYGAVAWR